jgi:flavin-dependent dehydrogenase
LDAALLSAARDAGTQILQPARCEAVEGGAVPTATVRDLSDNSVRRVEARWIVLADGKGGPHHPAASGDLGVKAHFQNVRMADDAIELFGLPGHYGGLAPIEDGFNAAFSVPAARLTSYAGNMDALMEHVIRQNVALHRRLAGAVRVGRWVVSPLPRFAVRRAWPIGVVPSGNAAAALEPIGGEGMGLALRSGEMAAVAIDAALRGGAAVGRDLAMRFDRLWRQRRFFCRALALALSHPTAARMIVALGRGGVGPRLALAALGKPCPSTRFATAVL